MTYNDHSKFPLKRCIIATIVIVICFMMVLVLLYSITNSTEMPDLTFILAIVWACCLGASILGYWIYQIIKYRKTRKDEK